jgi:phosphoglycolate phosphatase
MTHTHHWRGQALSAVLFDLDGTLLDTVGDIAAALNTAFAERQWESVALDDVRRMIGRGSPMLIQRALKALGRQVDESTQAVVLERFFHHYGAAEESGEFTATPYPGAAHALEQLHAAGLKIAVVTNKQFQFANGLLHKLDLSQWIDLVIGGDTCERRKPDPQPLLFACETFHVAPAQALMVGDSINDVQAARAAHIPVICVPYGYNEGNDPRTLPCDALIDTLADLPGLLTQRAPSGQ